MTAAILNIRSALMPGFVSSKLSLKASSKRAMIDSAFGILSDRRFTREPRLLCHWRQNAGGRLVCEWVAAPAPIFIRN